MTTVSYAQWNGSLLQLNLFTQPTTLVLSAFGTTSTGQLTDQSGTLYVGETVIMAGKEYTYLGSGTAQPGVNVLGVTVATGTKKDLLLLQDASGKVFFVYPDGVPNALGMVAAFALSLVAGQWLYRRVEQHTPSLPTLLRWQASLVAAGVLVQLGSNWA